MHETYFLYIYIYTKTIKNISFIHALRIEAHIHNYCKLLFIKTSKITNVCMCKQLFPGSRIKSSVFSQCLTDLELNDKNRATCTHILIVWFVLCQCGLWLVTKKTL